MIEADRPATRAALEHRSALASPGSSVEVESPVSGARVRLLVLPDSQAARAGAVRPRIIRATVTYLR